MASFIENLEFTKGPPSKRDGVRIQCSNYLFYAKTEFNYVCRGLKLDGKKCYSSITLDKESKEIIKVCGKKEICSKDDLAEKHGHSPLTEVEILALNFEKNLKVRAANETTPMPQIFQQEQSKMYKEAMEKGITTQEVAENFKTYESK